MEIPFKRTADGILIEVRVRPSSPRSRIAGLHGAALKVHVAAPPAEGEANRELARFLSKELGVPAGDVEIVKGGRSRNKVVFVRGVSNLSLKTPRQ